MEIKGFIANTPVSWFKRIGRFGATRFWILYWCYKLTGWHIRQHEWDFVLEYLPKLTKKQKVLLLDVGSTLSLFIYEVRRRGYRVTGLDKRPYQERLPNQIGFFVGDVRELYTHTRYDFITCISVLEHNHINDRREVFRSIMGFLRVDGRLLLTIPTKEYAQGHSWQGFTYEDLTDYLEIGEDVIEYTERAGQICVVITKRF